MARAAVSVRALETALRACIDGEVDFGAGARALTYAADASNYRQAPIGVVLPRTSEDVIEAVRICREYGAAILPRGAVPDRSRRRPDRSGRRQKPSRTRT